MITGANARARSAQFFAAIVVAALLLTIAQGALLAGHAQLFADFHAFYCGGAAALHGEDPYAAASIAPCEHAAQPLGLYSSPPGITPPVPFPGYAFVLFAPFAALAYVPAALLWFVLLVACAAGAAALVGEIAGLSAWRAMLVLAVPYAIAVFALGELSSIVLLGLCAAALSLRRDRVAAATAWLCVAALLPQVAAPVFVAILLWDRRARLAMLCAAAGLVCVDVAVSGPAGALAYVTSVLPAHAQSEIGYVAQYGVTWIAHAGGAPDAIALRAGEVSYGLLVAVGVWVAGVLARTSADRAILVLVPAAFAVVGGPFVHYSEMTLALPAILLLLHRTRGRPRSLFACALLLAAVPWQWIVPDAAIALPAILAAIFGIAVGVLGLRAGRALQVTLAALAVGILLLTVALRVGPQVEHGAIVHVDRSLAQASWSTYVRSRLASTGVAWIAAKLPTWAGVWLLAFGSLYAVAQKQLIGSIAIEHPPAMLP